MHLVPIALSLLACMTAADPAPAEAPEPAAEAPEPALEVPAPSAPEDVVSKDADLSGMTDDERRGFLMALGEKVYLTGDGGLACVTCHQKDGMGVTGAFPPLKGQEKWMGDCTNHAGLILDGLKGPIEVEGVKYNGVMVPQADALNDLQIAAVMSYVRQSWGNDFGFCSPEDVAKARGG